MFPSLCIHKEMIVETLKKKWSDLLIVDRETAEY